MSKRAPRGKPPSYGTLSQLRVMADLGRAVHAGQFLSMNQIFSNSANNASHADRQLRGLESLYQTTLVNRKTLELTHDGELAYRFALRMLELHDQGPFARRRQTLRVGTSNRVMTMFLAPKLKQFFDSLPPQRSKDHVDVDFELTESSRDALLFALENDEVDCAIFGSLDDSTPPSLRRELISDQHATVLIAAREGFGCYNEKLRASGEKVPLTVLSAVDLCVIRSDLKGPLKHLPAPGDGYKRIVVDNYASVVSVVKSRLAVGLVFDMGLDDDVLRFELDPKDGAKPRNVAIWSRADRELTPIIRRFMSVVLGRKVDASESVRDVA